MVGTSGCEASRRGEVTASARTRPSCNGPVAGPTSDSDISASPRISAIIASELARNAMYSNFVPVRCSNIFCTTWKIGPDAAALALSGLAFA